MTTVNLEALQATPPKRGRSKYRNVRVYRTPDGLIVGDDHPGPKTKIADSRKEYRRLQELIAEQQAGTIQWLRTQVPFRIVVNKVLVCRWVADFVYLRNGVRVVEDSKGLRTAVYKLKKRLVKACLGIDIVET